MHGGKQSPHRGKMGHTESMTRGSQEREVNRGREGGAGEGRADGRKKIYILLGRSARKERKKNGIKTQDHALHVLCVCFIIDFWKERRLGNCLIQISFQHQWRIFLSVTSL